MFVYVQTCRRSWWVWNEVEKSIQQRVELNWVEELVYLLVWYQLLLMTMGLYHPQCCRGVGFYRHFLEQFDFWKEEKKPTSLLLAFSNYYSDYAIIGRFLEIYFFSQVHFSAGPKSVDLRIISHFSTFLNIYCNMDVFGFHWAIRTIVSKDLLRKKTHLQHWS